MSHIMQNKEITGFKSITYSRLFGKYKKQFTGVERFTKFEGLADVLLSLFFTPYPVGFYRPKPKFSSHWIDNLGNSIYFKKNVDDNMVFIEHDCQNDQSVLFDFDIFTGMTPKEHIGLGDSFYCAVGKDIDTEELQITLIIHGMDDKIRSYVKADNTWSKFSAMRFGPRFCRDFYQMSYDSDEFPDLTYSTCQDIKKYVGYDKDKMLSILKHQI